MWYWVFLPLFVPGARVAKGNPKTEASQFLNGSTRKRFIDSPYFQDAIILPPDS